MSVTRGRAGRRGWGGGGVMPSGCQQTVNPGVSPFYPLSALPCCPSDNCCQPVCRVRATQRHSHSNTAAWAATADITRQNDQGWSSRSEIGTGTKEIKEISRVKWHTWLYSKSQQQMSVYLWSFMIQFLFHHSRGDLPPPPPPQLQLVSGLKSVFFQCKQQPLAGG